MTQTQPAFDGQTFNSRRDSKRLTRQLDRVKAAMKGGDWYTIADLAAIAGCPEASVSARIRDLRKPKFGSHKIEREYVSRGLWRYRMQVEPKQAVLF